MTDRPSTESDASAGIMKPLATEHDAAGDRAKARPGTWTAIASTAFMSGLAYTVVNDGVSAWLAARQVTPIVIGFFALCSLPYGLKWIWAPLLDRFHAPLIGRGRRRVGWLIVLGALSAALLVAAGVAGPHQPIAAAEIAVATDATWLERQSLALDELSRGGLWGFAMIVFALSFASASLDVVVDAFRTDSVSRAELGRAASVFVAGFRVASLVGGAGALFVAARLGWQAAFILAAVIMMIATITVAFAPEPSDGEPTSFLDAVLGPVRTFVRQWRITALALAAFVLMFRLPDLVGNRMVGPFLIQELGFTLDDVAGIRQFLGFGFTIAGAALGGVVIARLGIARSMLVFGVLQAASNLGWVWLDHAGKDRAVLLAAVAIENACNGMVGTVFVAFLMSLCDHRYSAAQYAILTGLMFLAASVVGTLSGSLLAECQRLTGILGGYSGFFIATIAMGVPGIAMVPWITRKAASRPGAA